MSIDKAKLPPGVFLPRMCVLPAPDEGEVRFWPESVLLLRHCTGRDEPLTWVSCSDRAGTQFDYVVCGTPASVEDAIERHRLAEYERAMATKKPSPASPAIPEPHWRALKKS